MLNVLGSGDAAIGVRIGIHSGPVAGGVIGTQKFAYDVWGNTVNIAARLQQVGVPGRVHVSEETMRLTSAVYEYEQVGPTELRGVGPMATYLLIGRVHS
jgi:adenylate cyclase